MRKQIFDALKAKFVGVSDAVLGRIADRLAKTVTTDEQVTTAVEGVTIQQVIESYGDSRANEAQQSAVHNYESKYGLKDGVKTENGGTGAGGQASSAATENGGTENVPAWAQAMIASIKSLTEKQIKFETERTTTSRRQQLTGVIGKLPEKLRKAYERTSVDSLTDEEFTALMSEVETEVGDIVNETNARGAVFGRPAAQGNNNQSAELTKEQEAAISHREYQPKEGQQPF